ncbi:transcription-repair coupling factor [Candidatus Planktophila dulcis]|uniref:transcription-repair coupling factor n=1 Tax=Candidatus Planktophila dulcis TaxID=1884914 RepID=UPI003CEE2755
MRGILAVLHSDTEVASALLDSSKIISPASSYPFLIALKAQEKPVLVITSSSRGAEDVSEYLRSLHSHVYEFPAWETLPHERLSPRSDTVARRLSTLYSLKEKQNNPVVVAPVRAVIHRFIASLAKKELWTLEIGQEIGLTELINHLTELSFTRTDLVEKRGEFAVRGGIVDVFLPLAMHPVRIDFFGDEIEELQYFEVADQRTSEPVIGKLAILPCRELLLTDAIRERAEKLKSQYPSALEILDKIAQGMIVEGMESLIPLLTDDFETILDRMPQGTEVIFIDDERIRSRTADLIETNQEFLEASWSNAAIGGAAPLPVGQVTYLDWKALQDEIARLSLPVRAFNAFGSDLDEDARFLDISAIDPMRANVEALCELLRTGLEAHHSVVFSTTGHGMAERYAGIFRDADLPVQMVETLAAHPTKGSIHVTQSSLGYGFKSDHAQILFVTERDLSGSKTSSKDGARMPSKRKQAIDPLELHAGDFVVHEQHGIGRYVELIQRTVGGVTREYLVIEYAPAKRGQPSDRIFVPTDTLEQVSKYVGGETPTVHRIGSSEWQKAKGRARKAVRQIAGELIRLYAARTSAPGFAFSPDTPWQRELEDAFSYIETPDQLSTIEDVKRDMERPYPMDRIICGDVGYGKTEIAIRAAFKAVQDGKQVAVLVPTTLLVQQHSKTFAERYAGFPIKVADLSRFNTAKESKEILAELTSGVVDVVVGTHRILSQDVQFKDLGLVIVDEEQRFGVEQKESLKKMRTTVDVLAMSATPIPRTLEMAVTGIREMSTITTPPEERHPILTYVGPAEDAQIKAAIHRELLRDGQIFYIHNRVESIDRAASKLQELVPEARIRIAHGQMSEGQLEDVILAFWNRDFDVLVCTTIVESGLDIANANTLIVERSENFGLSQLHQLRGRVGRGRERAYAYFLYPQDQPLSEVALDRLKTIATNTDLGSGMRVALKDLEIRGAGNLLGGEQSGHIADVGFDLYMRMVGEAVNDYKTGFIETEEKNHECKVELPINAHLAEEYVPGERLRLDLYRRLADVRTSADVESIREELVDRFGELPQEAQSLLQVAQLRASAKALGVREVVAAGKFLRISPLVLPESKQLRLNRLFPGSLYKSATNTVMIAIPRAAAWTPTAQGSQLIGDTSLLEWAAKSLDELTKASTT